MQKILTLALTPLLFLLSIFAPFTAYLGGGFMVNAEVFTPESGTYAYVATEDVFFYATPNNQDGLFRLPPTYYVRLLDYSSSFCKVEYQTDSQATKRLVGYVKTEQLTFVPYVPQHPYLQCVFEVEYKIDDATQSSNGFLTQIVMTCFYYGDYDVGSTTYCYVLREGEFGYIPKPKNLRFDENTEYADYLQSLRPTSSSTAEVKTKNNTPAQIAILVALCLLVPLIAALIIKPKSSHDPD